MTEIIDACGLSCPAPVLMAKKAIDADSRLQKITVMVDNEASMENVSRFLTSKNFSVDVEKDSKEKKFKIHGQSAANEININKSQISAESKFAENPQIAKDYNKKIMIFITTDRMGFGDDELGKKLMVSFIKTIKEMGDEVWRLVFVNNGVKLTVKGSQLLSDLLEYEADGLKIMVCGTCLTHFNLLNDKQVGETTNMLDIVTAMQFADKVINI